jgi:hypothetical protein
MAIRPAVPEYRLDEFVAISVGVAFPKSNRRPLFILFCQEFASRIEKQYGGNNCIYRCLEKLTMKRSCPGASPLSTVMICLVTLAGPVRLVCGDVVINQGNMNANGWQFTATDNQGNPGLGAGTGTFVTGPATPPAGVGSFNFQTASGDGDQSVQLRNSSWAGTSLSAITDLSYSTYATSIGGDQLPWLTLYVNTNGDLGAGYNDRIDFEPVYSSSTAGNGNPFTHQGPIALDTWQTWNTLSGMWYSDNGAPGSNIDLSHANGPGEYAITFQEYLHEFPNAIIVNDVDNQLGGIRLASGYSSPGDNYNTYVDALTIATGDNSVTYDFEPGGSVVPEPASVVMWSVLATVGLGICKWRGARLKK